jgi:pimeloyl-ACP methyl ester carboxylesterase
MSDGPYRLRALGETLSRRGYHVVGLRLPGHGTAPSGLRRATWEDMAAAVRIGARHLAAKIGAAPLHVIGYSNGAPLALAYTLDARHGRDLTVPGSLVLISPAIAITPAAALARWKDRLARLPGLEALAWTQILPEFDPFRYNSFASNAGYQVHRLTRAVSRRIAADAAAAALDGFPPTLVFLSAVDATVSTESVINHLLIHLPPPRNELVLFDVNRRDVHSTVMVADPGPLTARLLASPGLPFALTLLANERPDSSAVVIRYKAALSTALSDDHLRLSWPAGVISLSHIALPFPPDDPLYGRQRPAQGSGVFLGQIAVQGERGLLLFPADWLLRLRHNPFYEFLEMRTLQWLEAASPSAASAGQ